MVINLNIFLITIISYLTFSFDRWPAIFLSEAFKTLFVTWSLVDTINQQFCFFALFTIKFFYSKKFLKFNRLFLKFTLKLKLTDGLTSLSFISFCLGLLSYWVSKHLKFVIIALRFAQPFEKLANLQLFCSDHMYKLRFF